MQRCKPQRLIRRALNLPLGLATSGKGEAGKRFFVKKEAKTFSIWAGALRQRARQGKVFWFFFSKKNRYLPLLPEL
jgi:hypothetical protein